MHLDFGSSVRSELDKVAREWGSKDGRRDKSMLSIYRLWLVYNYIYI